jgi:hypothetical protein
METIAYTLRNLTLGGPVRHRNLAVFPLIGAEIDQPPDYRTLREAVAAGEARIREVTEGGLVPQLLLENFGQKPILIMDGEELIGAKQNRCANVTILAPGGQTLVIPVSCVEAGRWSYRTADFEVSDRAQFVSGRARKTARVTASLREAGERDADQGEVWAEIARKSERMAVGSSTAAMADIYEQYRGGMEGYVNAVTAKPGQVGALFAIGPALVGLDLFDAAGTFREMLPKLVRSYAIDALEEHGGAADVTATETTARAFLAAVAAARVESYPGVGLGTEVRLSAAGVVAGGLAYEGRIIHLAAFALLADVSMQPANDDLFMAPATRRRRMMGR